MKRRLLDWLSTLLERLLLLVDGHTPTKVRMKAVKPLPRMVEQYAPRRKISRDRAAMSHHCTIPWDMLAWTRGSWQCSVCRSVYTYAQLPRKEVTAPRHHVVAYGERGQYQATETFRQFVEKKMIVIDNRLCHADGTPVITGRLFKPMPYSWRP